MHVIPCKYAGLGIWTRLHESMRVCRVIYVVYESIDLSTRARANPAQFRCVLAVRMYTGRGININQHYTIAISHCALCNLSSHDEHDAASSQYFIQQER